MMNKHELNISYGCFLGKYKIYSMIVFSDTEFDIILEEPNDQIYYSFTFFFKDGVLDDEFYSYKLYGGNCEDIDVEVMREEIGHYVFDSVHNIAKFITKNGVIR